MNDEKLFLKYLMIILQLCLRLNTKQFMEKKFQVCQYAQLAEIPSMSVRLARGCLAEVSDHSNLKVLSPKQILQRLPIGLPQVKASDSSENVLTYKIRQIIYFLYQAKEITKKLYNNIMSSIKL